MATRLRTWLFACAAITLVPAAMLAACGGDSNTDTEPNPTNTGTGGTGTGGGPVGGSTGVCLLNNCTEDAHCDGCPDGRTICLEDENRCVACDPNTGEGCAEDEECSSFGLCVPKGLTCPVDDQGNPTVVCTKNTDCAACSPMNQVCDTETGKCQACIKSNTQHCLASDICVDGKCAPKCPQTCETNTDCAECGQPGNYAHYCYNHKCAACSPDVPSCDAGQECKNGVCQPPCGIPGPVAGQCTKDEDCTFCGDPAQQGKYKCKTPVNDPTHGTCTPPADGCEDLGKNVAVLPPPYDQYTQACSSDANCTQAQAGITYNVGKAIRDLIGADVIDVGFYKIKIQDANVKYAMPVCASIEIINEKKCGICVPCKVDKDCAPISVDALLVDLFKGDPLATIAGAVLIDLLWGDNDDHNLNFFCQPVAAGYGACVPCANPTAKCGKDDGGGNTGSCDHNVCETGGALKKSCAPCADTVCSNDSYCCDTAWDDLCVKEADQYCNNICQGGACAHSPCEEGVALTKECSKCTSSVCTADAFCCTTKWDSLCVNQAKDTTTHPDCKNACGSGPGCAHSECAEGGPLVKTCSACATAVCNADSFCCDNMWDKYCVDEAKNEGACNC